MVAQTRFVDYGARQYDPVIARWNAPDAKSDSNYRIYVFCNSNPIHRLDIDGNNDIDVNELIEEDLANDFDVYQDITPDDPKKFSLTSQTTSIKTETEILPQNPFYSIKGGIIKTEGESKVLNNDIKTTMTRKLGSADKEISTSIEHQFNTSTIIGRIETGLSNSCNSGTFIKSSASIGISFLDAANIQVGITNSKNNLESTMFISIAVNNPNYNLKYFVTVGAKPLGIIAILAIRQTSFSFISIPNFATATQ